MTTSSSDTHGKASEPLPFDDNKIDFSKFKAELSALDIVKLTQPTGGIVVFPFGPIDVLSPSKTIGRGRTNTTLISPTIVQTDATTPYASFAAGTVSIHFEPIAYGITTVATTYIMEFNIQTSGSATFTLAGYAGSGTVSNTGIKVINGSATVQLVMHTVQPSQQTWGSLQQTSGASWSWFSTRIKFPDLVISPVAWTP